MSIQKSKHRYRLKIVRNGTVTTDEEQVRNCDLYGGGLDVWPGFLPMSKVGKKEKYIIEITYLGEVQFKKPYAARVATQQRNSQRTQAAYAKAEKEEQKRLRF